MEDFGYKKAIEHSKQHDVLYQYTIFEALKCIVQNHSLRLTRIDLLNDMVENNSIIDLWKKKVFVACFTHRECESPFFWNEYSKKSHEGVRISFSRHSLENLTAYPDEKCISEQLKSCKKTEQITSRSMQIDSTHWGIFDYSILDIAYIDRNQLVNCDDNTQGRIKYHEWDLESETRLRVAIRPRFFESYLDERTNKMAYHNPGNKYIYLKLSDQCLRSMTITLSPYSDTKLKQRVNELLENNNLKDYVQISESILSGEVTGKA